MYKIERIGDHQLEPPVMDKVDMNWYGCECGCDKLFRANQMTTCPECVKEISKVCMEYHEC